MSKEDNKKLLGRKINLDSTYLTKEIKRRLKQASFIFNPSQKTLNCQLTSSQIKLFSEICMFLEQDDNLDILSSCIHRAGSHIFYMVIMDKNNPLQAQ
ncbi:hypothetical protein [Photorhabdus sp. SF281]|uniref:hypothetical protein n=1 Tax=Photorhabdus sp. SF281 TaxID=3459527 RepID=UPI00404472ED